MWKFINFIESKELGRSSAHGLAGLSDMWRENNDFTSWLKSVIRQLSQYIRYLNLKHAPASNPYMPMPFNNLTSGLRNHLQRYLELFTSALNMPTDKAIETIYNHEDYLGKSLRRNVPEFSKFYRNDMDQINPNSQDAFKTILQFVDEIHAQIKHWANQYEV